MMFYRLRCFGWSMVLTMGVAACVAPQGGGYPSAPPAPGGARLIGTLDGITGPEAYYARRGSGAVRARNGLPVYEGDHIYTGPGTRMILRFAQGGEAELDENTDPVPRFLADLGCLVMDLLRTGRMFVDGSAVCVGAAGTLTRQDSQVVYDVRPGYAQITVAGGRAELRRPQAEVVPAGWRVDATAREVISNGRPYQLTRAQVEEAVRWTRWYQQRRPALPGLASPGVLRPSIIGIPRSPEPERSPPQTSAPPSATPPATPPQASPGVQVPQRNFQRYRIPPTTTPQETIR